MSFLGFNRVLVLCLSILVLVNGDGDGEVGWNFLNFPIVSSKYCFLQLKLSSNSTVASNMVYSNIFPDWFSYILSLFKKNIISILNKQFK